MASRQLPPELWLGIFALACSDTGRTGRALSLVSKEFYTLTVGTEIDIQSVHIDGGKEIAKFIQVVERRGVAQRKVHTLFISIRDQSKHTTMKPRITTIPAFKAETTTPTIFDLFRCIDVSHLESLSIYSPPNIQLQSIQSALSLVLPHIKALSLDIAYPEIQSYGTTTFANIFSPPPRESLRFVNTPHFNSPGSTAPKLKYLRLVEYHFETNFDLLIAGFSPNLEELALSDCDHYFNLNNIYPALERFICQPRESNSATTQITTSPILFRSLADTIDILSPPNRHLNHNFAAPANPSAFPLSLNKITIGLAPSVLPDAPDGLWCGNWNDSYGDAVDALMRLRSKQSVYTSVGERAKLVVLPFPGHINRSEIVQDEERRYQACLNEWLDYQV